jgi:outer membrane protein assembly factor BamA
MAKVVTYSLLKVACTLLILLASLKATAQRTYKVQFQVVDTSQQQLAKLSLKDRFATKLQAQGYISKLLPFVQSKGFIAASVDSLLVTDSIALVRLYLGEQYLFGDIKIRDEDKMYVNHLLDKNKQLSGNSLKLSEYQLLQQKLLDQLENSGYPFGKVQLDSVAITANKIDAILSINKGIRYKIDSIRVYGPAKISKNFIHRYLEIERGSSYKKDKLENINLRLLELPYLQQTQSWNMTMLGTGSLVNLYLEPKKSNQVNILAGFLPSNQQLGGKLLLTVDANLQLQNLFGGGEHLGLVWQQIQPRSPKLNLQFQQPYIFNSPFGIDFLFELFKRDSTFLNINAQAGLQYVLSGNQTGKIIIRSQRSNVLMTDTIAIKNLKALPDVADVGSLSLGLDYQLNKTNYRFNPRRGSELNFLLTAGNKKIRKNNLITGLKDAAFNYAKLYDSVKLNTYQLRLKVQAAHYFPSGKQSVFKTSVNVGYYQSPSYFRNELFQIGGYRLLRGFDEESIFSSKYAVATAEYRYLLGLNSYFFGFTDLGFSTDDSRKNSASNNYVGAGIGLSFETKGGIFNISFAAGKRNDNNFNLRQSKIHFGYASIF